MHSHMGNFLLLHTSVRPSVHPFKFQATESAPELQNLAPEPPILALEPQILASDAPILASGPHIWARGGRMDVWTDGRMYGGEENSPYVNA